MRCSPIFRIGMMRTSGPRTLSAWALTGLVTSSDLMTQTQRTAAPCSLSRSDAVLHVRRHHDGKPVLIIQQQVEKLGQRLLCLALLQNNEPKLLIGVHLLSYLSKCFGAVAISHSPPQASLSASSSGS